MATRDNTLIPRAAAAAAAYKAVIDASKAAGKAANGGQSQASQGGTKPS